PDHPDRELVAAELVRWTRALGLSTPTALMQRALPDLLVLRPSTAWLGELREHITERPLGAGYDVVRADATFFVYVRTPHGTDDLEFTRRLAARGLLVLPAPVFHHSGYFRLALTGSGDMIERAITILESAAT
ncbi:MAG: aminotransferase class I/II-fold pyridoxal phosphate-dependent enzyme, partial [Chloroflexota bacterium]